MRKKRFLAVVMAASMVLSSSVVASAANIVEEETTDHLTGQGGVEAVLSENVFRVELPVISENTDVFNFILDPQELIKKTNGARYDKSNSGNTTGISVNNVATDIEFGSMYFGNRKNGSLSVNYLSGTSDSLTIRNLGAVSVDVALSATISGMDGIALSTNDQISGNDQIDSSVYLALVGDVSGNSPVTKAITEDPAAITTVLSGNGDDFGPKYVSDNDGYEYVLDSSVTNLPEYSFALTGASGGKVADWKQYENITPTVDVVWTVKPYYESVAPTIATGNYTAASGARVEVAINLGTGDLAATGIASIAYKNSQGQDSVLAESNYQFADGVLTFGRTYVAGLTASREFTITLNDANKTSGVITITP